MGKLIEQMDLDELEVKEQELQERLAAVEEGSEEEKEITLELDKVSERMYEINEELEAEDSEELEEEEVEDEDED